jgi:hypothetical protein
MAVRHSLDPEHLKKFLAGIHEATAGLAPKLLSPFSLACQ